MRGSCDLYIVIDMFQAIKDGIDFYISSNNVILTEGIKGVLPPQYFKSVTSRKGEDILKRDMKKVEENE
jgi:2'-phosphotransferase